MGRHSLPDEYGTDTVAPRSRGRTVAIATAVVLVVAAGTTLAVRGGFLSFGGACGGRTIRLDVVASPDVAPALQAAADHARKNSLTSDGQCLDARVQAADSYKIADALRRGDKSTREFEAWVPDSSLWIQRAGLGEDPTPVTPMGNVASSPIGVSMVPSAAKSMGWPAKTYTWAELTGAAMQGDELRLGTADPARSATGLLALSQLGKSSKKGGADSDTQAAALAKALSERTVDSDAQLTDTLPRDSSGTEQGNPRRNQALILSEQSSFRYNESAADGDDLDLFYPKDGAPALDYPFTLLDEGSQTTDQRRAATRFMTLLGEDAGLRILHKQGFRTDDEAPSETLVAGAGGRTPQPYATADPEPPTDKELQETLGMWTITVQSARITVVVDASGSMANPVPGRGQSRMEVTKASMLQALATFTPEDEIGLWEFSTHLDGKLDYKKLVPTERLGDRKGDGTQRDRLSAAFSGLQPVPGGATGLYDTTLAAYQQATASYAKGKFNALVVVTDGANEDPGSISRSNLISRLEDLADPQHPVPLIAMAVGPDASKDEVEQMAAATNGSGHQVNDPAQIHSVILKAIMEAGAKS
ncbi:substrate-binding and VWA domain-containing protein [Streptomyces sp. NPDC046821]|uniref:substrate-binding and VWA domain-containing protein n=1 Tax=Streptomyces sp. NPDC046821 TaxID=3154702 RepID=UPI0033FC969D